MSSILKGAADTAHAAVASLFAAAEIKVGDAIPSVEVKEDNPTSTISLANLAGKNIIVRGSMHHQFFFD